MKTSGKAYKKERNRVLKMIEITEAIERIDEETTYEVMIKDELVKLNGADMKQFMKQKYKYYYK